MLFAKNKIKYNEEMSLSKGIVKKLNSFSDVEEHPFTGNFVVFGKKGGVDPYKDSDEKTRKQIKNW